MTLPPSISAGAQPNVEDCHLVEESLFRYDEADADEKIEIFENELTALATTLADRYRNTANTGWVMLLAKLNQGTAEMSAEDISSIVDHLIEEPPVVVVLRGSDFRSLAQQLAPDPGIDMEVSSEGCQIIVEMTERVANSRNYPIYEGTMSLFEEDGAVIGTFPVCTGGGSRSYRITNGPLPPGRYIVSNYRPNREVEGMSFDGVSYSFDLLETDGTRVYGRSAFRIHPDGAPPGTRGCVGVRGRANGQREVREQCKDLLERSSPSRRLKLAIRYVGVEGTGL